MVTHDSEMCLRVVPSSCEEPFQGKEGRFPATFTGHRVTLSEVCAFVLRQF